MGARTKARKRALDYLYAAELRGESPVDRLTGAVADGHGHPNPYTEVIVRGVVAHREDLDEVLARYSRDSSLARMPAVDRNVLRIALWEMIHAEDVPATVAVSEAVGLVRELSTRRLPGVRERPPGRHPARPGDGHL